MPFYVCATKGKFTTEKRELKFAFIRSGLTTSNEDNKERDEVKSDFYRQIIIVVIAKLTFALGLGFAD
ncbi:hypothetical protein CKF58_03545 [Psittacicella hinzii]|uniref:Uncharacterized protein n=1 Tax=Psittacicella hinzii TaxID=2028575 RepID=A0A3A1YP31_9GAMM|nr:hypothetical protein CKF58_03545 [Psittacicella hinzii]